MQTIMSLTNA